MEISVELVEHCFGRNKSDCTNLSSFLCLLPRSLRNLWQNCFHAAVLRHGHMPAAVRDCVFVPIPKPLKDPSNIGRLPLLQLSVKLWKGAFLSSIQIFVSSDQVGFSMDLCTGNICMAVHADVFGCFLDASKLSFRLS